MADLLYCSFRERSEFESNNKGDALDRCIATQNWEIFTNKKVLLYYRKRCTACSVVCLGESSVQCLEDTPVFSPGDTPV